MVPTLLGGHGNPKSLHYKFGFLRRLERVARLLHKISEELATPA